MGETNADTYSDRRRLEGPYPQIRVGSVVEVQITTVTRPIMDGAGIAARWWYGGDDLVIASRLEIVTPAGMPLTVAALGEGVPAPTVRSEEGRSVREYRATLVAPPPEADPGLPRDVPPAPLALFLDRPVVGAPGRRVRRDHRPDDRREPRHAPERSGGRERPAGTATNLVRWINERVRYIGLELGENYSRELPPLHDAPPVP